ncbi:hypothetical protein LR48_Vigan484s000700 [Vigna angularis]|uniref:Uncharacterized protein n=1 Tax=Phaseolus angularis TaxID=3914 RepID=A0A0L9TCC7_PHAAN|nr:hypothetical protein LR48_Vigan484s000700 [Vigna angularis]
MGRAETYETHIVALVLKNRRKGYEKLTKLPQVWDSGEEFEWDMNLFRNL